MELRLHEAYWAELMSLKDLEQHHELNWKSAPARQNIVTSTATICKQNIDKLVDVQMADGTQGQ